MRGEGGAAGGGGAGGGAVNAEKSKGAGPAGGRAAGVPAGGGPIRLAKSNGEVGAALGGGAAGAGGARLPKSNGDAAAGGAEVRGGGGAGGGATGRPRSGMREASTPSAKTPGRVCSSLGTPLVSPNLLNGSALSSVTVLLRAGTLAVAASDGAAGYGPDGGAAEALVTRNVWPHLVQRTFTPLSVTLSSGILNLVSHCSHLTIMGADRGRPRNYTSFKVLAPFLARVLGAFRTASEFPGKPMSEAEQTAREPKVIKQYTNRKLYDTVESRYVTLDEIADMVKQGVEVQIVDNRTKEDLTSVTLAQIVFEEEKKKNQMPLSVLREIIRRPQDSLNEITATVTQRVATFREEATNRLDKLLGREAEAEPLTPAALLTQSQKVVEAWQAKIDERVKHAIENVLGNLPALGRDLNTLVQRIEQMEKRISEIEEARRSDEPRRDEPRRGRER